MEVSLGFLKLAVLCNVSPYFPNTNALALGRSRTMEAVGDRYLCNSGGSLVNRARLRDIVVLHVP